MTSNGTHRRSWARRLRPAYRAGVSQAAALIAICLAVGACGADPEPTPKDAGGALFDTGGAIQFGDTAGAADTATDAAADGATADAVADGAPDDGATLDGDAPDGDTLQGDGGATDGDASGDEVDGGGPIALSLQLKGPSTLTLASAGVLEVWAADTQGQTAPLANLEGVTFEANGKPLALGFDFAAGASAVGPIALWTDKAGALHAVGVRPGKAEVVARKGAAKSPTWSVEVAWPAGNGVVAAVPDAAGATDAKRVADIDGAIKLAGKSIGSGGLDASVRFEAGAPEGTVLELGGGGVVAASAGFADLAGTKYSGAQGWMWIDQTSLGVYRGTVWSRTTSLKPLVLAFVVPREGDFGIDLLDDKATKVATSDAPEPTTGVHHSRVSVLPGAPGKERVHLVWRRIDNGLKASLQRLDIASADGVTTPAAPILDELNAYDTVPTTPAVAVGAVELAWNGEQGLLVWEGRETKGATKPHLLWAMRVDADLKPLTPPLALGGDTCAGACRPRVLALTSGRMLVLWSGPGGVRARRIKGPLEGGVLAPQEAVPVEIAGSGAKDGDVALQGAAVLVTWFDPDKGPVWRPFQDKATGALAATAPAQALGLNSAQAPPVALDALTLATPPPNQLFVAAWIDLQPSKALHTRRIGVDGTSLAASLPLGASTWDGLSARSGKPGQWLLVGRTGAGAIELRKRLHSEYKDPGADLGATVTLVGSEGAGAVADFVYEPSGDVWVLAWSGSQTSAGVWFRRFR